MTRAKKRPLWKKLIADGKQEMYGRSGFKTFIFDDHQLFARPKGQPDKGGLQDIKEYSMSFFENVADYDRKLSPYDRTEVLEPAFL